MISPEILADEEAIETSERGNKVVNENQRPEILADEEAIETTVTCTTASLPMSVLRYSLTKKRLRR